MYRTARGDLEVLIAHPGGPFWERRDSGAWSIPKGIVEDGEDPMGAARREFTEEIGTDPGEPLTELGSVKQKSGKTVHVWAVKGDFDPADLDSHILEIEYPWRSGRFVRFPEIDRVLWASPEVARKKLNSAQAAFVERLEAHLELGH